MTTVVGDMLVNFRGSTGGLTSALGVAKTALSDLTSGNWVGAVTTGMAVIGGAAVGFGIASVSAASSFQESMDKVQAYAGMTKTQTDAMGQSILAMAPALGVAPKALADGLYFVASAGFKGADALNVLKYAGETAAASNTDASVTSRALSGALNAMGEPASQAGNMMDILNATVQQGVMTWPEYGTAVGRVGTAVASSGVSAQLMKKDFVDANAGLDIFSNTSMTARQASTNLAAVITVLDSKTDSIATHAKKMGISFDETKFKTMDLQQQMAYLGTITDHQSGKMVTLMGGNSAVAKSIDFLNANSKGYGTTINKINEATKNGATTQGMFAIAQSGLAFQMKSLQSAGQALMITIGQKLLPVITGIVAAVTPVVGSFTKWLSSGDTLKGGLSNVSVIIQNVGNFIKNDLLPPAMQIAHAFMDNVVPAVQHLGSVIIPLITNFISWTQNSGLLKGVIGLVGGVVSNLVGFVGNLVTGIANVTGFFADNQTAAESLLIPLGALGGYFVYLGVQAIISFIAAAPAMIAGFVTGAAAAWTMAAGVIAATWPFIAIGAAVGLVILIIVLLVQHWGAVSSFLSGVWHAIAGFATTIFTGIKNFFVGVWNHIIGFIMGVWNNIVAFVKDHALLLLAVITGPIGAIVILIVTHWNQIKAFFVTVWNDIIGFFVGAFHNIVGFVQTWVYTVVTRFQQFKAEVEYKIQEFVQNIVQFFQNLHTQAVQKMQDLIKAITDIWTNFTNGAANFGKNLVQGIISGITNMLGNLGNTMHNVVSFIGSFLPHSPAKQGELSNLNRYGPALVQGFADGITTSLPILQAALNVMVKPVAAAVGYPISPSPIGVAQASSASQQSQGSTQGQTLVFEVDSHQLATMVNTSTDRTVRVKLGSRSVRAQ